MTADELKAWVEQHGGVASVDGPDANGIMTYRANSGDTIAIRPDGSLASRGYTAPSTTPDQSAAPAASAPTAAPAAASAAPAQAAPAGPLTTMTQDQVGARLAEVTPPGVQLRYVPQSHRRTVPNPAADPLSPSFDSSGSAPKYIDQPYVTETWYAGNTPIFAGERQPDGTFNVTLDTTPRQAANQQATTPRVEGTPIPGGGFDNTKPIMVARDANGNQVGQARPLNADERQQWERDKNGGKTDAQIQAEQTTASDAKPVEGYPGWTTKTTKVGNDTKTVYINPQGAEAPDPHPAAANPNQSAPTQAPDGSWGYWDKSSGKPVWTALANGPAGKKYTQVQQDPDSKKWYGLTAAGQWEGIEGGPGAGPTTASPGPAMPTIVAGQSEQALTTYHEALANDPSLTPQQRKDRFAEMVQVANASVNDANAQERATESSRNAQVTLASNRLTFMQNGLDSALKFVMDMNDKLPQGSDAGAKAFAAIMGINMLQLGMSGINDINTGQQIVPPVLPAGTPPAPTIANPANPADVNAARDAIANHPAATGTPSPQSVTAPAVAAPRPAPAPASPPASQGGPPPPLGQGQDLSSPTGGVAPPTPGEPGGPPLQAGPVPQVSDPNAVVTTPTPGVQVYDPTTNPGAPEPGMTPAPVPPNYGQPGMSVLPDPNAPSTSTYAPPPPMGSNDLTMAPSPDLGILAQYQTPPSASPAFAPPPSLDFGPDPSNSPPILHSLARTLPPWMIDEPMYRKMKAAGVPDNVIASVPGQQGAFV